MSQIQVSVLKCDKLQENAEFEEMTIGDKNNLPVIDNGLDTKQLFGIKQRCYSYGS